MNTVTTKVAEVVGKMRVRVDESGTEGRIAKIDYLRALGNRDPAAGVENLSILHDNDGVRDERLAFAVKHSRGFERDGVVRLGECAGGQQAEKQREKAREF